MRIPEQGLGRDDVLAPNALPVSLRERLLVAYRNELYRAPEPDRG